MKTSKDQNSIVADDGTELVAVPIDRTRPCYEQCYFGEHCRPVCSHSTIQECNGTICMTLLGVPCCPPDRKDKRVRVFVKKVRSENE